MNAVLYPLLVAMLAATWWYPGLSAPDDEELALRLLREYEAAVGAYDVKAATALELDLTRAVVAVDGNTARVMDVGNRMGEWESKATYTLTRTPEGWRIRGVETER